MSRSGMTDREATTFGFGLVFLWLFVGGIAVALLEWWGLALHVGLTALFAVALRAG